MLGINKWEIGDWRLEIERLKHQSPSSNLIFLLALLFLAACQAQTSASANIEAVVTADSAISVPTNTPLPNAPKLVAPTVATIVMPPSTPTAVPTNMPSFSLPDPNELTKEPTPFPSPTAVLPTRTATNTPMPT
ncbi:MAG: hypothetical protein GY796_29995, partial [Chloroflexi bacterium]|nr:hypothetical protein [Chloroflexota bacterium]